MLTHRTAAGAVSLRITEVEAYAGVGEDPGSHAHRGERSRTRSMFGPAGHLYAYFTYGMHTCANIVCLPAGSASAVLLRAGEVVDGAEVAAERRRGAPFRDLARGPARLTVALAIALANDGADLLADPAWSLQPPVVPPGSVLTGPRTGVAGEGGGPAYPWRFWIEGDPTVSPYRRAAPRRGPRAVPGAGRR